MGPAGSPELLYEKLQTPSSQPTNLLPPSHFNDLFFLCDNGHTTTDECKINPFILLRESLKRGRPPELKEGKHGSKDLVFQDLNIAVSADIASGHSLARRRGSITLRDIYLKLTIPKESYNFRALSSMGSKFINVYEWEKIMHWLNTDDPDWDNAITFASTLLDQSFPDKGLDPRPVNHITHAATAFRYNTDLPIQFSSDRGFFQFDMNFKELFDGAGSPNASSFYPCDKSNPHLLQASQPVSSTIPKDAEKLKIPTTYGRNDEKVVGSYKELQCIFTCDFGPILKKYEEVKCALEARRNFSIYSHDNYEKEASTLSQHDNALNPLGSSGSYMSLLEEITRKHRSRPIIIIPSEPSTLINKNNVVDLLQNGKFIAPRDSSKRLEQVNSFEIKTRSYTAFELIHLIDGKPCKFNVVESTYIPFFREKDWKSVVAVVVHSGGGRWQFKNWHAFSSLIDLFQAIRGYMFVYESEVIPSEFLYWKLKVFRISRSHRYNDAVIQSEFWHSLEEFVSKPRPRVLQINEKLS